MWLSEEPIWENLQPGQRGGVQAELYKKIDPETAKAIIAATYRPNRSIHGISTLVNNLPISFLIRNDIDKDILMFEDTCGGYERLFYSPIPVLYTRHTDHLLKIWKLLLTFGIYDDLQGSWNEVAIILLVAVVSIFFFGVEEFSV